MRPFRIAVPEAEAARYAFGYRENQAVRVNPGVLDAEAYGAKSTVTDMTHFLAAHLGTAPIAPDLAAALARTRVAAYDTASYAQGLIWEEYDWPVDPAALETGNGSAMALEPQPMTPRATPLTEAGFLNRTNTASSPPRVSGTIVCPPSMR